MSRIEDRIKAWREAPPGEESEEYIELLCDAEDTVRSLRRRVARQAAELRRLTFMTSPTYERTVG